nr:MULTISPECIES: peptidoglycan DD-metalloendopeptidase family protein [unclassified Pseudomonas]
MVVGLFLSTTLALLAACSSTPKNGVNVVDRNGVAQRPAVTTGQYAVRRGDTLFSIAFRYGWDWKALAARNNIAAPFTIVPGQVIRFDGRSGTQPAGGSTTTVVSSSSGSKTTVIKRSATAASAPAAVAPMPAGPAPKGWGWPSNGILIGKFSSNGSLNKGIDIAGDLGQPVLAASDGSVVYAGSGLRGYGELIIIKHSDTYVSAYGHNRRLLVREGQQVKVGQTIAEMGSTGTDRVKLHFEIRRQGKPVDPLQFLPRR